MMEEILKSLNGEVIEMKSNVLSNYNNTIVFEQVMDTM